MNTREKIVTTLARVAVVAFLAMTLATFSGIYGWLHPALWGVQGLCFLVVEGAFYYLRGPRPALDMAVALAMWTSLGTWISVEHFGVVLSAIVVMGALPEGNTLRVVSVIVAAGIVSLIKFADVNPWSSEPGAAWLHHMFFASCVLNAFLVLLRATMREDSRERG